MGEEPTYSETDCARILERAAELQEGDTDLKETRQMSLPELEHVAAEAGIDKALVRRAAAEVAVAGGEKMDPATSSGSGLIAVELTVMGEASADTHELMLAEARRALGDVGAADVMGKTLIWHTRLQGLEVASRDGMTTIRLTEKTTTLAADTFGPMLGLGALLGSVLMAGLLAATGLPVAIPFVLPIWVVLVVATAIKLFRSRVARRREVLRRTVGRLGQLVEVASETDGADEPQ